MAEPMPDPPCILRDEHGAECKWATRPVRCRCKRSRKTFKPMFSRRTSRPIDP